MFPKKFIAANKKVCDYDCHVAAPLFRRSFKIESIPKKAIFTVCGLGFYGFYLNGERMTKGQLAPYINNPNDILYYDKYDFTEKLKVGENVIGIMLGNGFFNCFGGFMWGFDKAPWRGPLRVAFSLEIDSNILFESDETAKVSASAVTFDELRIGAFYDARLEQKDWNNTGFDDSGWDTAKIVSAPVGEAKLCRAEPVVINGERKPVSITHYDDFCFCCKTNASYSEEIEETRVKDTYVYDFGVNDAGICRLKIRGHRGQQVKLRFGEMMTDGRFTLRSTIFIRDNEDTSRYISYPQMDIYTCSGDGEEEYVPPFTYHGFRYVLVEGITPEQAGKDLLTYLVISSDLDERASFSCSDEILNKLFAMTRRSDRSNFVFYPTDCPHREKNGWTGDASLSAEHMLLHMKAGNSLSEWLTNIRKAQRYDGALPGIIPTAGWGFDWGNGPIWDSVCVNLPFYIYKFDGDTGVISDNKEMILSYLKYAESRLDDDGLAAYGLEDWCQPKLMTDRPLSPIKFTDSATLLDMSFKAAHLFDVIGDNIASDYARKLGEKLKKSIRENLIDFNTMTVSGNCQTSQAVAIAFDIFDSSEKRQALNVLINTVKMSYDHINAGILGGRYIFHVLAENGYGDLAYKMIARTDAPSYGAWAAEGGTTLYEHFSADGVHRSSQNHHFWGDILSFFIQKLAGLRPNPYVRDVNECLIAPVFVSELSWAQASYRFESGTAEVKWEREGAAIRLDLTVPDSCHGEIKLPDGYVFTDGTAQKKLHSGVLYVNRK